MSTITTHILDTTSGRPVAGVRVTLSLLDGAAAWRDVGTALSDADGRANSLLGSTPLAAATYRLHFETAPYFAASATPTFFPFVDIAFTVTDRTRHHHVPLLLSPFGYSTYRGS